MSGRPRSGQEMVPVTHFFLKLHVHFAIESFLGGFPAWPVILSDVRGRQTQRAAQLLCSATFTGVRRDLITRCSVC